MDVGGQPERIIGRYALYGVLASGGMATVHLGRLLGPVGFSRTVAIKKLHEQYANDPEFVSGFVDEARLAARIRHPSVVPTLDVVATEAQLFLVMEYVQGESLARLRKAAHTDSQPIPIRIVIGILTGTLHGLHAAHEARGENGEPLHIVHRDVSPQNILVGIDGVPRVLDFGVAKAVGRLQTTNSGQLKGKVAYMSPEQLRSESVDRRTDVFAASVVLWELLAGRRLFSADNEPAVLAKVLLDPIEPPSTHAPEISKELDAIVMRGLARDVSERWQTARDMAVALEEHIAPATATQIGVWVEDMACDALALRAELVAMIESVTHPKARMDELLSEIRRGDVSGAPFDGGPTGSTMTTVSPTPKVAPRRWISAALLVALVAMGATAVMLLRSPRPPSSHATAASQSVAGTASVMASASTPIEVSAAVAPTVPPATASSARPLARPATAAPPKIDCSNPYIRDDLGRKIYRKECLE